MAKKKPKRKTSPQNGHQAKKDASKFDNNLGNYYARVTVPHDLDNPEKRAQCGLPEDANESGPYIIELNIRHKGSLPGAANDLVKLFDQVLQKKPIRISKSYYRCQMNVPERRKLLAADAERAEEDRCIYKLWPDFPLKAQIDGSITTIKADAAQRAFDAGGHGIVWAVIDSGIDQKHPHFGTPAEHTDILTNPEVNDLHRYFAYRVQEDNGVTVDLGPLESPDLDPMMRPRQTQGPH